MIRLPFFFVIIFVLSALHSNAQSRHGYFVRNLQGTFIWNNEVLFEVNPGFGFVTPERQSWPIRRPFRTNGASIPRVFWSFIGHPFGRYLWAAVIHDYYCGDRNSNPSQVDRVFYQAMLASGIPRPKAWIMYQAVAWFGAKCHGRYALPLNRDNLRRFLWAMKYIPYGRRNYYSGFLRRDFAREVENLERQPSIKDIIR